jgi:transposase InsO family protein
MSFHSINRAQRLYVLKTGSGFSCLGFDVAEKRRRALWAWVGQECPDLRKGFKKHYDDYRAAVAAASHHSDSLRKRGAVDWRCPVELEPALKGLEGRRVEVTAPDGHKSRFIVGRSTGWMPCHLEIKRRDSIGGCAAYVPKGATVRVVA